MQFFDLSSHQMVCSKGNFTPQFNTAQINGQLVSTMKFCQRPTRGTEIFLKNIPRDALLQDVLEFVVHCGDVYQIRLLMDFSGYNRGYCFVTYFNKESARKAVVTLNGAVMGAFPVVVKLSFDNNKLELRGVPPGLTPQEIFITMGQIAGVESGLVQVLMFRNNPRGRNVCVLKYNTHRNAIEARKKMWPKITLWAKEIEVEWAIPHEIMNSKRLYFRNVPPGVTKLQLYDEVTKYVKPVNLLNMFLGNGLGYFLFSNESAANEAFHKLYPIQLCGTTLHFSFSRFIPRKQQATS